MTDLVTLRTNIATDLRDTNHVRWVVAEKTRAINRAMNYITNYFVRFKCWHPLTPLHKMATYTLIANTNEYDVYTVIGGSTDYKCFIKALWDKTEVREVTVEDEEKIKVGGEYEPTRDRPRIRFFKYDTGSGHGNLPKFELRPTPTTADTCYFYYLRNQLTLSADVDIPYLLGCDDIIEDLAKAYLTLQDKDPRQLRDYLLIFNDQLDSIVAIHAKPEFYPIEYLPVD